MKIKTITVEKTARYVTIGNKEKADVLIIALHGYGHLNTFFSEYFKNLDERFYVIIPEGLNRFYISGTTGRVGASWMTKEERLIDIGDNLNYLNKLYENEECKKFQIKILIGFSQGASTGFRWHIKKPELFQYFISWGSAIPNDLDYNWLKKSLASINYFVLGNRDPYFNREEREKVLEEYINLDFKIIKYDGEHKMNTEVLKSILRSIK